MDLYSRKIIAWEVSTNTKKELVMNVFKKAYKIRKPNNIVIVHSDKGTQYRCFAYRRLLIKNHCVFSYTSLKHSCDENANQESFHASLKKECIYNVTLYHFEDAYKVIFDYIEGFYNPKRIHSSIGYHSPVEFENFYYNSKKEGNPPSETSTKY